MPEVRLGRYKHWKGGDYEVLAVAILAGSADQLVVYRSLPQEASRWTWARPVEEFCGRVEVIPGKPVPRFEYVGSTEPGPAVLSS